VKTFNCQACQNLIFFDNIRCMGCGRILGYLADVGLVSALEPAGDDLWRPLAPEAESRHYRMCLNYRQEHVCNWMINTEDGEAFCLACRLNQMIPDLSMPENRRYWQRIESAKRWLVYGLLNLHLPLVNKQQDPKHGLAFAFLSAPDPGAQTHNTLMTGHDHGLITLNVAEADDAVREEMRLKMHEGYRTLLGHFRHEVGHYYWDRLIDPSDQLESFRKLFGDERVGYDRALQHYYNYAPPADWQERFVSAYASMHPWEDWAESWAHYLHIVDTLETARNFSLKIQTPGTSHPMAQDETGITEYQQHSFTAMMESWFPLTCAINSLNRSMGQPDMYPFVLSPTVIEKLGFVHDIIGCAASQRSLSG
jgi:hypothetical protein